MGLATEHCSLRDDDSTRAPWHCDSCGIFLFNRDSNGYPVAGAPSAYFGGEYGGKRYEQVCTLCYQMKDALQNPEFCQDKNYWRAIQNTVDAIKKVRREKYLKGGGEGWCDVKRAKLHKGKQQDCPRCKQPAIGLEALLSPDSGEKVKWAHS